MAVVSSVIIEDHAQVDGRRHVRERHTTDLGDVIDVQYVAEADADVEASLAPRAAQIEAQLVENEHEGNKTGVDGGDGPRFRYTTQAQFLVRLTARYAASSGLMACRIGRWFHQTNLGDAALRNLFGITQAQVAGLRAKFSAQNTVLANLAAETGVYP